MHDQYLIFTSSAGIAICLITKEEGDTLQEWYGYMFDYAQRSNVSKGGEIKQKPTWWLHLIFDHTLWEAHFR